MIGPVGSLAARNVLFIMRRREDGASNASREQKHQHQHGQINEGPYGHTPRIRRPQGSAKWARVFMWRLNVERLWGLPRDTLCSVMYTKRLFLDQGLGNLL